MGKNRIIGLYIIIVYVLSVAFSFLLPQFYRSKVNAATGINNRIHFQGKVVNSDGTNVNDGTYDFVIKMYDGVGSSATALFTESWTSAALLSSTMSSAPSSGGESLTYSSDTNESSLKVGQILWNTTKQESVYITSVNTGTNVLGISPTRQAWAGSDTITNKLYVKNGIFVVEINSLNVDFSGVDFNSDTLYLGVNFNADGEMKPRIQYTSVPYAFNAAKVAGLTVTNTTGTFTLANSKTLTVNNTLTFSGTDGTSFTFPSGSGTVVTLDSTGTLTNKTIGAGGLAFSGADVDITTASNEHFSIIPGGSGKVGIGTTSPGNHLTIAGGLGIGTTSVSSTYLSTLAPHGGAIIEGNVGIGTTNPGGKLHVSGGSLRVESTSPEFRFIESDQTAPNGRWRFIVNSDVFSLDKDLSADYSGIRQPLKIFSNETILFAGSAGNVGIGATGPSKLTVSGSMAIGTTYASFAAPTNGLIVQGNMGIGVSSPTQKLHVSGNTILTGTLDLQDTLSDSNSDLVIADNLDPSADATYDLGDTTTSWKDLYLTGQVCFDDTNCFSDSPVNVTGWTDTGTSVYLTTVSDKVGIGTTSPGTALEVFGTSTQVKLSYDSSNYSTLGVDSAGYLALTSGATNAVGRVQIGLGSSGNATPDLFGLDVKSDTGDPAGGFEGAMYYNTFDNKFRCYQNSGWTDCIGTGGAGPWTDGSGISYLTDTAEDFAVGGTALAAAFSVDVSANTARIGTGTTANAVLNMYGSDGDTGSITYTTNDGWAFAGGNVGIGTTNATSDLHVVSAANTGTAMKLAVDALDSGTGFSISSTGTALSTGTLASIDWSPASTANATGDLFTINIGANGSVGNLLNIKDNGTSLFLVSEAQVISSLPASFTAAGDVSISYDLVFTNQTASYIKSNAPLAIEVGELWESNNLILKTYNSGNIVLDAGGKVAVGSGAVSPGSKLSVAGGVAIGTTSISSNFHTSAAPDGGLLVEGNVGIGRTNPGAKLEVFGTSTQVKLSYDTSNYSELDVDSSGYLTLRSGATNVVGRVQIGVGSGGNATPDYLGLAVKSDTGDPAGGFEGAMYYNTFDNKFRCYQNSGWTDCIGTGGSGPWTDATGTTYLTDTAENLGVGTTDTVDKIAVVKSSTASGVDGVSIAFTQTDDTDNTDTNTGLQVDITNSSTDADNLYGVNIAGITGGAATEYALVIGSGWDRGLSVSSASTIAAALTIGSSGNTFTFDPATGPVYAGTARPTRQLKFPAEYEGATLTASGSATITGNMTADTTRDADLGWMNYYEWTSTQGSLQDYSVAIKIKLPSDFSAWATSNAVQINFATEVTDNAKNKLDVWIYNMTENPDQIVSRSLTNASSPAADWEVLTIDDSEIDDGTAPDWDAADETAIIYLKSSSLVDAVSCTAGYDNGCYVRLGDITLNYLSKF